MVGSRAWWALEGEGSCVSQQGGLTVLQRRKLERKKKREKKKTNLEAQGWGACSCEGHGDAGCVGARTWQRG